MSLQPLPKWSSPTDLCDGGVAPASDEVQSECIRATAGFSGGRPISVHRLSNEAASMPLRQAIAELSRVNSDAAARIQDATTALLPNLSQITPAYQIRQAIARKLNVNFEAVVLFKGAKEVVDSNPDETGPFQYIVKTLISGPFLREVRSRAYCVSLRANLMYYCEMERSIRRFAPIVYCN